MTSDEEAFGCADAVFVGSLTDRTVDDGLLRASDDPRVLRFDVSAVYKGAVQVDQEIVTAAERASCGLAVLRTGDVLVFANEDASSSPQPGENQLSGDLCNGTRSLDGGAVPATFAEAAQPEPSPLVTAPTTNRPEGPGGGRCTPPLPLPPRSLGCVGGGARITDRAARVGSLRDAWWPGFARMWCARSVRLRPSLSPPGAMAPLRPAPDVGQERRLIVGVAGDVDPGAEHAVCAHRLLRHAAHGGEHALEVLAVERLVLTGGA